MTIWPCPRRSRSCMSTCGKGTRRLRQATPLVLLSGLARSGPCSECSASIRSIRRAQLAGRAATCAPLRRRADRCRAGAAAGGACAQGLRRRRRDPRSAPGSRCTSGRHPARHTLGATQVTGQRAGAQWIKRPCSKKRCSRSGAAKSGAASSCSPRWEARTKSGKPRPGTGGYGKRKLEGKGPTPPADMRPGHPAQRRAAQAKQADQSGTSSARCQAAGGARSAAPAGAGRASTARSSAASTQCSARRWSGRPWSGRSWFRRPWFGRPWFGCPMVSTPVVWTAVNRAPMRRSACGRAGGRAESSAEALRARVPATALHVGPRLDADERIGLAVMLAADAGIPVVEAGRNELDRLTGGAIHQGLALRIERLMPTPILPI